MARTILSAFVVWSLLFSGVLGLGASLVAVAGDEPIEEPDDWNCNTVLPPIYGEIELDYNLNLLNGCVMTVQDGGIIFAQDNLNRYALNINSGATLRLINSYLTVETNQIESYLLLPVNVAGTLYGENANLQFPGFINVTGTIELWDSDVTSLDNIPGWVSGGDRFNDAPVFHFNNGQGQFYRTTISPLLNSGSFTRNDPALGYMYDFNVTGTSEVWFVDSYLDIDYDSLASSHNVLYVRDTSKVYAYNLSIDTTYTQADRVGAIRTTGSGVAHILRWANVLCVDYSGVPIQTATLTPRYTQTGGAPTFPDSLAPTPHNYILTYIGKTTGTWLQTGANGRALVPLPSELIDDTVVQTTPNSDFFGVYDMGGSYQAVTTSETFSFNPYPAMNPEDGTVKLTLRFMLNISKPNLVVSDIRWNPSAPTEGDNVSFEADITNLGVNSANDIWVCFYIDGQPLNNTPTYVMDIIGSGTETTPVVPPDPTVYWQSATGGNHSVRVLADCYGTVSESNEGDNDLIETVYVVPLLPDYNVTSGSISFPANNYIGNTVRIDISVLNSGNGEAPENAVDVYIGDPSIGGAQHIGQVPIGGMAPGVTNVTYFEYTFNEAKDYKICIWVDKDNTVFEASESNNRACRVLRVDLAPNLKVTSNDIGVGNPCTRMGETVTPQAIVRNVGYVSAGAFSVDFYIDGDYFASGNSTGLASNASQVISANLAWIPNEPGIHVLSVDVDPTDNIKESTKADNTANKDVLIFHDKTDVVITSTVTLPVDKTYASNIDITGSLTIDGKTLFIQQADPLIGRYCIKVYGTGSLILKNGADLQSNYPLVIYVTDSASLIVDDADLDMDILGTGGLFADASATIDIELSTVNGNIFSTGAGVSLKGVDLLGSDLYIETSGKSNIWDVAFTGVQNLYLLSDDSNVNTVDFDIRNVSFDEHLDVQLLFKGNQLIELTNVSTNVPIGEMWHTGMIAEKAKIRLYWWLTTKMVDGTGAVLDSLTPEMSIYTLDGSSLIWNPYLPVLPIDVPNGTITFRVLSEEVQYYPVWAWTNSTYSVDARVQVGSVWFYPDTQEIQGNWTGDVRDNMVVELKFSGLTPDFSVSNMEFVGDIVGYEQPVNRHLQINATVYNSGNIAAANVEVMMFIGSTLIGYDEISVPASGSSVAVDDEWMPTTITTRVVMVCVDWNNTIQETNEDNNCRSMSLKSFGWPDLSIEQSDVLFETQPVEQTGNDVMVLVKNLGTGPAVDAVVTFQDDNGWSDTFTISEILVDGTKTATMEWAPQSAGIHYLTITVSNATNAIPEQTDYDRTNNMVNMTVLVLTLPDLEPVMLAGYTATGIIMGDDPGEEFQVTAGVAFKMIVRLNNSGGSSASNFTVSLVLDAVDEWCRKSNVNISAGASKDIIIDCKSILDIATHTMTAVADSDDVILESNPDNNQIPFTFEVVPPSAYISIDTPAESAKIKSGSSIDVEGWVKEVGTDRGIEDVELVITIEDTDGNQIGQPGYTVSKGNGRVITAFTIPDGVECEESYTLNVRSNETFVLDSTTGVVGPDCPFEIELWVWILILVIIIVVAAIAGATAYIKIFGLGKLVECGECGAFIPEDSTACPKCGVQFETETAKCSNCQAWVPLDVKKCPECGVEFATGEVEMEDYRAKMRMRYDEVKKKIRREAEIQLGKSLTDREFDNWWRTQATFVTFEEWLKQEEDMRKMGSKPCPSCGTLNSVTATVCHKCGSAMVEEEKPRRPPARPPQRPREAVPAKREAVTPVRPAGGPPAAAPSAAVRPVAKKTLPTVERPVPKKVIKKPVVEGAPTVVPKKIVRKPEEEEEEGFE